MKRLAEPVLKVPRQHVPLVQHQPFPSSALQALGMTSIMVPAKILALHAGMWADVFQELVADAPQQVRVNRPGLSTFA